MSLDSNHGKEVLETNSRTYSVHTMPCYSTTISIQLSKQLGKTIFSDIYNDQRCRVVGWKTYSYHYFDDYKQKGGENKKRRTSCYSPPFWKGFYLDFFLFTLSFIYPSPCIGSVNPTQQFLSTGTWGHATYSNGDS